VIQLYRRSPHVVSYWSGRELVFENYSTQTRVAATPRTCEILHCFDRWRPAGVLALQFPDRSVDSLARALADLIRVGLIQRSNGRNTRNHDALASWKDWSPAASFFHFSTKDAHAPMETAVAVRQQRRRARAVPLPPPVKRYRGAPQVALPKPEVSGEFPRVLLQRRTWRQFSRQPVTLEKLATLLGLTFGVQWWLDLDGIGRLGMKTSPSGGARHPIEPYVLALRVDGLRRGLYHYNGATHRLELLRKGATAGQLSRYVNGQEYFGRAAALVVMTAVFARSQWKYPRPKAYRSVLADAGHITQTFCLVATWLGLAPFCTMALADSAIEHDLGVDGVTESVMYTAGVGCRPAGMDWAPWAAAPYGQRSPNRALHPLRRR
jgi:SagB-type dehydrogenase family enzyme